MQSGLDTIQKSAILVQTSIDTVYSAKEAYRSLKTLSAGAAEKAKNLANNLGNVSRKLKAIATGAASIAGPATIAATSIGLIGYSIYKYYDAHSVNAQLSESYKELEKRAKETGKAIKDVNDVIKNGAFKNFGTEIKEAAQKMEDAAEKFKQAKKEAEEAQRRAAETAKNAGMSGAGFVGSATNKEAFAANKAEADYKNAVAAFAILAETTVKNWNEEQKTELERLEDARRDAERIQEFIKSRGASEEALTIANKQILNIEQKIKDAKNAQAESAVAEEKARQERLRANGIANYLAKAEKTATEIAPTIDAFNETVTNWQETVKNGDITQEELEKAIGAYKDDVKAKLFSNVGYNIENADQTADKYKQLEKALGSSIISQREYNDALKQLKEKDDELARQKEEEAKENARQLAEQEIGIDFNRIKNAYETLDASTAYKEKLARLSEMMKKEIITQDELNNAQEQLKNDYWESKKSLAGLEESIIATQSAEELYNERLKDLAELYKDGAITQEKYNKATEAAAKALKESKQRAETEENKEAERNADAIINQAKALEESRRSALEKAKEAYKQAQKDREANRITEAKYRDAVEAHKKIIKNLNEQTAKELAKQKADAQKEARSKLGIDSLIETFKTPLEKYRETMQEIETAAKARYISKEERAALEDKAAETYWDAIKKDVKEGNEQGETARKFETAQSMRGGSEALYLAQVRNSTANYQTRTQASAKQLAQYSGKRSTKRNKLIFIGACRK